MEITRDRSVWKLFLSQQAYVEKVLKRFNMNNAKPVTVLFAAHFKLSVDMSPKIDEEMEHMSSVPYSSAVGSIMAKMSDPVVGYVDSNFTGDLDKRRSLIGYLFTLSESAISWKAALLATVALSTTKAE
ncbi:hypothetical protein GH714_036342 [Hevea brasiliensis]|uniref:Reverse transcriptase Ty1/copia-type domain-containing protein n=1 Tax=Hevea brasiliensis TaxID=3981 RepID=A0A6A6KVS7_HEVBR|nr:hypothetical protein GH714_036342 [Hevea brasiliensis]